MSFDRDLKAKEKAKYDDRFDSMEREAAEWISEVLNRPAIQGDLCDALKDGTTLCELANAVTPTSPIRFKKSASMPFIQMENIASFLRFCSTVLDIPQHDLFQTIDLYERKNVFQVVQSLHTFSRYAVSKGTYQGRFLGPKMATSHSREFTPQQLREAKNHVNTYQYGKFNGSTNVLAGGRRDPAGTFH